MISIRNYINGILVLLMSVAPITLQAQIVSFEAVRSALGSNEAARIENDIMIVGHVINSQGNPNLLHTPQHPTRFTEVDLKPVRKVMYIQSADTRYGFRLEFETDKDAKALKRFSLATINLNGTLLRKEHGGYILSGLTKKNIISQKEGSEETFPRKVMAVSDVTQDDIFTFVTLRDCEFMFKDGAYVNVHELYTVKTDKNAHCKANGMMDGWGSLVYDASGAPVYMMLNSGCLWRRDGKGIPQGSGTLSGIVTDVPNARYYGEDVENALQIRPMNRRNIDMTEPSRWKSICEWNWSDNVKEIHTDAGERVTVTSEAVLSDIGTGSLKADVIGKMTRKKEPNCPSLDSDRKGEANGVLSYGALNISARSCNWWDWEKDSGNGITLEFSTKGLKGKNLILGFSFAAGNGKPEHSLGYPVYWCVEYSTDGLLYERANDVDYVLNTLPYWRENDVYGVSYPTSLECGLGFTEHLVRLPVELLGRKKVYVRIRPSRKIVGSMAFTDRDRVAMRPELKVSTNVSFGSIAIRYNR